MCQHGIESLQHYRVEAAHRPADPAARASSRIDDGTALGEGYGIRRANVDAFVTSLAGGADHTHGFFRIGF